MASYWTNDKLSALITQFHEHPVLWNPKFPGFRDRMRKGGAWNEIANNLNLDRHLCERKMNILRTQFRREWNKKKKQVLRLALAQRGGMLDGVGIEEVENGLIWSDYEQDGRFGGAVKESKWYAYASLKFLEGVEQRNILRRYGEPEHVEVEYRRRQLQPPIDHIKTEEIESQPLQIRHNPSHYRESIENILDERRSPETEIKPGESFIDQPVNYVQSQENLQNKLQERRDLIRQDYLEDNQLNLQRRLHTPINNLANIRSCKQDHTDYQQQGIMYHNQPNILNYSRQNGHISEENLQAFRARNYDEQNDTREDPRNLQQQPRDLSKRIEPKQRSRLARIKPNGIRNRNLMMQQAMRRNHASRSLARPLIRRNEPANSHRSARTTNSGRNNTSVDVGRPDSSTGMNLLGNHLKEVLKHLVQEEMKNSATICRNAVVKKECISYGEYVGCRLQRLSAHARSFATHLIDGILYEADLGIFDNIRTPGVSQDGHLDQNGPDSNTGESLEIAELSNTTNNEVKSENADDEVDLIAS